NPSQNLPRPRLPCLSLPDGAVLLLTLVATLSNHFSSRQDVSWNEWRVVIVEPALFYLMLRSTRLQEREWWALLDAFVLGGVVIALIGLGQYALGSNLITAEEGLMRLRATYGSPNNVALYLGRVWPLLLAMGLLGTSTRRRRGYVLALLPVGLAWLLTFSKGGLFLGMPASLLILFTLWQ
ncbi:MAG: hypothetical protein KC418_12580, partial [Anaerolineales bacterium]|nr:hypothetical protein [Anaerolineales bacterium]